MLSEKEIKHIANLARIRISGAEEDKFRKELSLIIDYINKLNELDTENVEPLYQVTGLTNSGRPDKHRADFEMSDKLNEKLIGQAPRSEKRFIKVKSVLNKNG
ncbi:MAG: hypothetical protein A3B99_02995 [Candidatus Yanofskybacteria bacterium RIFCSPHIGHO2_02_FULL_44_12b]|uniref:Aspartyl/glutamyl-tRNA(Asn/Gln) amidotransferase subunit C n=2 Tax=Candidatus Yanofskyibacteriota TaxID=1752733 RepID=A0A1F8GME7_9BACT|nr:MAG: Aspartyl/glutamyl-tRNA(Asn/Gln) amidotransferase subunit C [Candidatus Yanofskybacteria bacterium GW2011_GWA2_44_9]OGN05491.1 MAG: hypothetical protein A2659_02770 [Candidatus Yanofskybacteria bacterium RIFCSPHIGHO2_01_FULL_44_24]OGN15042.1 MAG: hypothetical protein A3B99_02995 [Candidatus Yanofskybacteria bacterium RIFCSPHIGHO2_02_FULL_44_12b]OGN26511.1 MAG: hypothetical protein A2925_03140 [Candidatus Yanofskybacteria bacterium RIFCSPLOWO2_01_FULL_44_22]